MNSSCGTHAALYATQSLPLTCWHACKSVGPSVLGLVLVRIGCIPDLILKGDRQRHTVCLALDKYNHDIQKACSLASQFILASAGQSDAPAVCKLTKPSSIEQCFSKVTCTRNIDTQENAHIACMYVCYSYMPTCMGLPQSQGNTL